MEQLEQPKCPKCNKIMSPAGGIIGLNITTYWACWDCNEHIHDIEVKKEASNKPASNTKP